MAGPAPLPRAGAVKGGRWPTIVLALTALPIGWIAGATPVVAIEAWKAARPCEAPAASGQGVIEHAGCLPVPTADVWTWLIVTSLSAAWIGAWFIGGDPRRTGNTRSMTSVMLLVWFLAITVVAVFWAALQVNRSGLFF